MSMQEEIKDDPTLDPKITALDIAKCLNLTPQAVHQRLKKLGLQEKKSNNKTYFTHETARKIINKEFKQFVISVSALKGGVGKTTIVEALCIRLALWGIKVLAIDLDQQANLTRGLGMRERAKETPIMLDLIKGNGTLNQSILRVIPGLDLIPSRLDNVTLDSYLMLNRKNPEHLLTKLFMDDLSDYEIIIFDCPPTLGSVVCASMLYSDLIISPLNPDVYSYESMEIMRREREEIYEQYNKHTNWKILLNKHDSRTMLSEGYLRKIMSDPNYADALMESIIRSSQEFPNVKSKGKCIFDTLRKTTAKEDIDGVVIEIINMMNSSNIHQGQLHDVVAEV